MGKSVWRFLFPVAAIALATISTPGAAVEAPKSVDVSTRLILQEGLAIALASTVINTQLAVLLSSTATIDACQAYDTVPQSGSIKLVAQSGTATAGSVTLMYYFDNLCQDRYARAEMHYAMKTGNTRYVGNVSYYSTKRALIGELAIDERVFYTSVDGQLSLTNLAGLGTFTPANFKSPAHLGLTCQNFLNLLDSVPIDCQGGIVQNFPSLGRDLGSVSPLTLTQANDTGILTFQGAGSAMGKAAPGLLVLSLVEPAKLGLTGTYKNAGSTTATGTASQFTLFPPTPTNWTITDAAHDLVFQIAVVDNSTRASAGTVVNTTTNQTLATFSVDQSGTGTVTYAKGKPVPISGWVLGD